MFNLVFIGTGTLYKCINLDKEVNLCAGRFDGGDSPGYCYTLVFQPKDSIFSLLSGHTHRLYIDVTNSHVLREEETFSVFPVSSLLSHTRPRLTALTLEQSYQLHLFWQTLRKVPHSRRCIFCLGEQAVKGEFSSLLGQPSSD